MLLAADASTATVSEPIASPWNHASTSFIVYWGDGYQKVC